MFFIVADILLTVAPATNGKMSVKQGNFVTALSTPIQSFFSILFVELGEENEKDRKMYSYI